MIPPPRRTELDKAKEQIAELQAQVRVLLAGREAEEAKAAEQAKQNERLREALHIAIETPNGRGVTATNATATNATTATTDPM